VAQDLTREQMIADIRAEIEAQRKNEPPKRCADLVFLTLQLAAQMSETLSMRMITRIVGHRRKAVQEACADLQDRGLVEWKCDKKEPNRAGRISSIPHYGLRGGKKNDSA